MALTKVSTGLISADLASVDLNIDANTLYIDVTNNRVGIGNTGPATALDVTGTVTADGLTITAATPSIQMTDSDNSADAFIQATDGNMRFYADDNNEAASSIITFNIDGGEKVRITDTGSVGIGTVSPFANLSVTGASASTNDAGIFQLTDGTGANTDTKIVMGVVASDYGWIQSVKPGTDTLDLSLNPNGGNVGIGTVSPSYSLDVDEVGTNSTGTFLLTGGNSASDDYTQTALLQLRGTSINPNQPAHDANSSVAEIRLNHTDLAGSASSGNITFYTNPSNNINGSLAERMRIDSSGNVGIGTTNPTEKLALYNGNTYNVDPALYTIIGTNDTAVNSNAPYRWRTGLTGDAAGYDYTFSTLARSESSYVERMRIDSSGNLLVGGTAYPDGSDTNWGVNQGGVQASSRNTTATSVHYTFYNTNGAVGTISTNGSATAYNTSSDYRLKENVVAISGATERLKQLKPSRFNFIADPDTTVDGFLAHEVQDIVPEAITGTKDAVNAEGNPEYQGIDQSKLVPLLVATIQELEARITALEGVN